MCLAKITETYDPPLREKREAWKVVGFENGYFFSVNQLSPLQRGVWMKAEHKELTGKHVTYTSGFHAFTNEKDASEYYYGGLVGPLRCIRVLLRGVRIVGQEETGWESEERDCIVLVADEMYIPEEQ